MSTIISSVTSLFNAAIGWVGDIGGLILGASTVEGVTTYSPNILTLFCILPLVGLGIGLFKRLISTH